MIISDIGLNLNSQFSGRDTLRGTSSIKAPTLGRSSSRRVLPSEVPIRFPLSVHPHSPSVLFVGPISGGLTDTAMDPTTDMEEWSNAQQPPENESVQLLEETTSSEKELASDSSNHPSELPRA